MAHLLVEAESEFASTKNEMAQVRIRFNVWDIQALRKGTDCLTSLVSE